MSTNGHTHDGHTHDHDDGHTHEHPPAEVSLDKFALQLLGDEHAHLLVLLARTQAPDKVLAFLMERLSSMSQRNAQLRAELVASQQRLHEAGQVIQHLTPDEEPVVEEKETTPLGGVPWLHG